MQDTSRRTIEDLIDMASRLESYHFNDHIRDVGLGFHMEKQTDGSWDVDFDLPDDKERDATLYAFRLFDQQNEAFSFHNLNKLAKDLSLSAAYRDGILSIRDSYMHLLEGYPSGVEPGFFQESTHPNRGQIMRVVMNGGLGHRRDLAKREQFKVWTRDPIREAVLFQRFTDIVHAVLGLIMQLLALSKDELASANQSS